MTDEQTRQAALDTSTPDTPPDAIPKDELGKLADDDKAQPRPYDEGTRQEVQK